MTGTIGKLSNGTAFKLDRGKGDRLFAVGVAYYALDDPGLSVDPAVREGQQGNEEQH
jgi:hypothetical protein